VENSVETRSPVKCVVSKHLWLLQGFFSDTTTNLYISAT
jgi:hypothetical protein